MKVKITLLEEVLGSSPSNEELLATYIASKAPTSDLTTEEVDNIKAQNAEDRITVFPKTADGTTIAALLALNLLCGLYFKEASRHEEI